MAMRMTYSMVQVAIALLDAPADQRYGYALRGRTGLASGVLHPILGRMVAAGWLEAVEEPVADSDGDRPLRRYHHLTDDGRRELSAVVTKARSDPRFASLFSAPESGSPDAAVGRARH